MKGKTNSGEGPFWGDRFLSGLPMRSQASSWSSQRFSFLINKMQMKMMCIYRNAVNLRGGTQARNSVELQQGEVVGCSVDVYGNNHTKGHWLLHSEAQQEPPVSFLELVFFCCGDLDCPCLSASLSLGLSLCLSPTYHANHRVRTSEFKLTNQLLPPSVRLQRKDNPA